MEEWDMESDTPVSSWPWLRNPCSKTEASKRIIELNKVFSSKQCLITRGNVRILIRYQWKGQSPPMELDMNATLIPHEMEVSSWEKQGTKLNGRFSSQSYTRG